MKLSSMVSAKRAGEPSSRRPEYTSRPFLFLDVTDGQLPAFVMSHCIARAEPNPRQRRVTQCVVACLAAGRVEHYHQAVILGQYRTQAEFRFAVAYPALSRGEYRHLSLLPVPEKGRYVKAIVPR